MNTNTTKQDTLTNCENNVSRTVRGAKYVALIVAFLSLSGIGTCLFYLQRVNNKMMLVEKKYEILTNTNDSTRCTIDDNNLRLITIEAAQKEFDSYIDSQSNLLTLFSILITAVVALVGCAVPIIINREQGLFNREKINEEVEKGMGYLNRRTDEKQKEINEQTGRKLDKIKKEIETLSSETKSDMKKMVASEEEYIKVSNDRIELFAECQKRIIVGMMKDLDARLENYVDTSRIENIDNEDERIREYSKMEEEGRATSNTFFNLGMYYAEGNPDLATEYFAKAVENRETYAAVYPIWADVLEGQGQLLEAWEKREKAMMLNPNKHELEDKQKALVARIFDTQTNHPEKKKIPLGKDSFDMILVGKGIFTMGATKEQGLFDPWANESPVHKVLLGDYYISRTLVTKSMWEAVMGSADNTHYKLDEDGDLPMCNISWNDCNAFIKELNKMNLVPGYVFHLPTEAQWEYAARGGNKSRNYKYSGSNDINEAVWYWRNSGDRPLKGPYDIEKKEKNNCRTHSVKDDHKKENELGLLDMSGNVWEWCRDKYWYYSSDPQVDPVYKDGQECVIRGGGFSSYRRNCRVSSRYHYVFKEKDQDLGFRIVLEPEKE